AVDRRGDPKPAYWGVARTYRDRHPSASFATCAWGGEHEVRARVHGDCVARIVDLAGNVVAESRSGEIAAPLDAIATDVFLLDLGTNRYVMTRTMDLAPLLDLPRAQLELAVDGGVLRLAHAGGPAALGVVLEDARPYEA